ncbi:hypothetical protein FBALC1_08388 [Flavobacteriales bacterium ALC-1]|nr:hypothetical protein FBALC1_08388 [Flavobacteriales bacterium ALC-1]
MSTENKNQSGKTFIDNEIVVWEFDGNKVVNIPIDSIKLIAEYTTASGPFIDDWFLVIYNAKAEYFEISMYADNIQEMMKKLGEKKEFELVATLFSSTEWESNILYPTEFDGQDLWNIVKCKPKSPFEKLKSLIGINKTELELTEVTEKLIKD